MPIPDYQAAMLPLLKELADGQDHALGDVLESLAVRFELNPEERRQLLPSGKQPLFNNRIGWARTYLRKAALLDSPKRAVLRITERGKEVLAEDPGRIDKCYLERFPEFMAFLEKSHSKGDSENCAWASVTSSALGSDATPEDAIDNAYQALRGELAQDLISRVKESSADFFERLVIDVLVNMGYGGTRQDAGQAVGGSGDGGIDGIIKEDRLGLDAIYLQAKRWKHPVGRPEVQKFAGALQGHRARKGVFLTTSTFTREARDYAAGIDPKIILVDGDMLTELMIDFGVGATAETVYEVKKLDGDYFDEL